jgi:diaminopimelate decarboxylase
MLYSRENRGLALVSEPLLANTAIFPESAGVDAAGHLTIGGCDSVALAACFGTPLYVFDEATLRNTARAFRSEFEARYPTVTVAYACKAYVNRALARLFAEEGLGADVVSGGELEILHAARFPLEKVYFHGNNKGAEELARALALGVGQIVVDNFHELSLLERLAVERGRVVRVLLRVSPGIDPHTGHGHTTTGIIDSKFGFTAANGQAEEAVARAQAAPALDLAGLHAHLGSPIFELDPFAEGVAFLLDFAAQMRARHGLDLHVFSPGGGFAIQYVRDAPPPSVAAYADAIVGALRRALERTNFAPPHLVIEPGRSLVGRAGVALYTVGARKEIPGVRTYVAVDGGMADNIRPAIYGSKYEAVAAGKVGAAPAETVTIAGKYCESGDILIRDIALPRLEAGDTLAIPAAGAYCLAMSSNYNAAYRPAVVLVRDGQARLIRRRETAEDLMRLDAVEETAEVESVR